MDAQSLRALQAPLKRRYKEEPATAETPATARGQCKSGALTCTVETWAGAIDAGLHPATGGDGSKACSADMLLEALVACAGVTLQSVATVLGVELRASRLRATGQWDARGTLGVSKEVPVGLTDISLHIALDTDADEETIDKLISLTERYCVIYQTLRQGTNVSVECAVAALPTN